VSMLLLPNWRGAAGAGLAILMITIAAIDARCFIIPDGLTVTALALGLLNAAAQTSDTMLEPIAYAIIRGVLLAVLFLSLRDVYRYIRGREGIGLGDVKLAGVAGAWLDWTTIPIVIEISALGALAVYLVRHVCGHQPLQATTMLPFGLFFAPAIWLGWLLGAARLSFFVPAWQ
jgi:leader peptidase (prepilin peptidase)/N-methyltransferase